MPSLDEIPFASDDDLLHHELNMAYLHIRHLEYEIRQLEHELHQCHVSQQMYSEQLHQLTLCFLLLHFLPRC